MNFFDNYELQREELLARIAQELELNPSRKERMEQAYAKVLEVLKKDEVFFTDLEIELYAQGSVRIKTTVRPLKKDDFDLDTVLHIYDVHDKYDPAKIYNALVRVIEADPFFKTICEKKDRCIRLNYQDDFHIDILPGCMVSLVDKERIAIPEKKLQSWSSGNPKGFASWFLDKSKSPETYMLKTFSETLIKAEVDAEPLPDDNLYDKTPLQRSVQLVKRYRDIYFENRDNRVSSIVITTLMGMYYNGEESIYDTIDNILSHIKLGYDHAIQKGQRFKVLNPVDNQEDFTDSWTQANYDSFYAFIDDLYAKWERLKQKFDKSGDEYIKLFGEGLYKESLRNQAKLLGRFAKDSAEATTGLVLNQAAKTDKKGVINPTQGIKNEPHRNFGGCPETRVT